MGLFSGIKGADPAKGRAPFIPPGDYLVEIKRNVGGKTTAKKQPFFRTEMMIHRTLSVWEDPPDLAEKAKANATIVVAEGERPRPTTWHVNLGGDWGDTLGLGNVKNFVIAALEPEDDGDDWTEDEWEAKCEECIAGEGTLLSGIFLIARCENRPTKAGGPFTVTTWAPGDELAEELGLIGGDEDESA
jgi:hypothetical protein